MKRGTRPYTRSNCRSATARPTPSSTTSRFSNITSSSPKNSDFVNSFILDRRPCKLLLTSTGNIRNAELEALPLSNLEKIAEGFDSFDYIELNQRALIFHV